jgi:hypothetical protein
MVLIWVLNNAKLYIYFEYYLLTWITHASQMKKGKTYKLHYCVNIELQQTSWSLSVKKYSSMCI